MAHMLETHEGKAAFFTSHDSPEWHRLGESTGRCLTAEEAGKTAYLNDWNVHTTPVWGEDPSSTGISRRRVACKNNRMVIRTNPFTGDLEGLATVGKQWKPVQNEQAFEALNFVTDEYGAHFETAGSLFDGRQTFMTMKMPEDWLIGGEDATALYLICLNYFDGTGAFRVIAAPVRVVCWNTQQWAIRAAKASFTVRHTGNIEAKIADIREGLGMTVRYMDTFEKEMEALLEQPFSEEQMSAFTKDLLPDPQTEHKGWHDRVQAQRDQMLGLFSSAPTNDFGRGTKYAAWNAVTEWADFYKPGRADVRARNTLLQMDEIKPKAAALLSA